MRERWGGLDWYLTFLWENVEKGHLPTTPSQDFLLCIPRCPSSGWHWNLFSDAGSPIRVMCGAMVCGGCRGWMSCCGRVGCRQKNGGKGRKVFMSTPCSLMTAWGVRRLGRPYLLTQPLPLHTQTSSVPPSPDACLS